MSEALLELQDIRKQYWLRQPLGQRLRREPRPSVVAVDGVTLAIPKGSMFGLVGESGSGRGNAWMGQSLLIPAVIGGWTGEAVRGVGLDGRQQGLEPVAADQAAAFEKHDDLRGGAYCQAVEGRGSAQGLL